MTHWELADTYRRKDHNCAQCVPGFIVEAVRMLEAYLKERGLCA